MNAVRTYFFFFLLCLLTVTSFAQKGARKVPEQCATMPRLLQLLNRNPSLKARYESQRSAISSMAARKIATGRTAKEAAATYIPIVFHIVATNPEAVTDAEVQAQLDTLNRDYFGTNADSSKIPSYFKPLFGKSNIQFCLAQRTPDGEPTTGIVRVVTTKTQFSADDDGVKHSSTGGADAWDPDRYFNVWLCSLSDGVLGYATFPDMGLPEEQGVVVDYGSLPGGSLPPYNGGKTLTHETGHYFGLFHIWGDDDGACTGTDDVDDTPNQADATTGCYTGRKTDDCTTGGNGINYQNYMDYSYDACLVMFTNGQVARMESTLANYRPTLLTSDGCQPAVRKAFDAQLRSINSPARRICGPTFTPVVTLRNNGSETLTSATITTIVDNGQESTTTWTGSLATNNTAGVSLKPVTIGTGSHTLVIFVANPNAKADENNRNDTLRLTVRYDEPVTTVKESFENSLFPPQGWEVINPDGDITWQRVTGVAKTGNASVMINNLDYDAIGEQDDLQMPPVNLSSTLDSAFLSFQVAAATYTPAGTPNTVWDTLQVLVSTDCGLTYTSLYKKWSSSLVTHQGALTTKFVPTAGEWRKDSINLGAYIGKPNLILAFRNTTGYENNIYLDDVNLRTVFINPNLKSRGFLVTPNPTSGQIAVQFYPQPSGLKGVQLLNSLGQKLDEVLVGNGQGGTLYNFNLARYAPGMYIVRAVFATKVVIEKIIKY